jgi:hypothetical protein
VEKQFRGPLEVTSTHWVAVSHTIRNVDVTHMPVIPCHDLRLHSSFAVITEIPFFWWGIWSKKLEEAKIAPPPVSLVGQVQLQQMLWDWTATITSTGQKNAANSAAGFAQPAGSEVAPLTSVRSVMWVNPVITTSMCACVWWPKSDPRCHGISAAARIMWVIKYLHYILYTACNREA